MTTFVDKALVAGVKIRASDGALLTDARIARTGIQKYLGKEVDPDNEHGFRDNARMVRVYRPGSEVFSADTMASAAHRPVTNNHPSPLLVDSSTWKGTAVGNTADEVSAEGIYLRVPLMVSDAAAIEDIMSGKRELSAGYTSILDWTPGKTQSGEEYDAVQKNIRFNHVAIVQYGRAGSAVRIGDAAAPYEDDGEPEGESTMSTTLKTVTVDGLSIEVTDQGSQVINKLQATIDSMNSASKQVLADHSAALALKDTELAKKDAEIADLRTKILDAAAIDKLVADRAVVVDQARKINKDVKIEGLDIAGIKKSAVIAALGDAAVADKSQAYIDARFDVLVENIGKGPAATADSFRAAAVAGGITPIGDKDPRPDAYAKMVADEAAGRIEAPKA